MAAQCRSLPVGAQYALSALNAWRLGRTAIGAEIREEGIYSSSLGREMEPSLHFPVRGEEGIFYTRHDARTNVSYFMEHNVLLRRWTLSAGVIADRNTSVGRGFRFYPGVDVSFRPVASWRLYASWNNSIRLPTCTKGPLRKATLTSVPRNAHRSEPEQTTRHVW